MTSAMDGSSRRALAALAVTVVAIALCGRWLAESELLARGADAPDTVEITPAQRAAGPRFASTVTAGDRAWILAAIAHARPEAQRLIAEVDGTIEFRTHRGDMLGVARLHHDGSTITLDVAALNGDRTQDRKQAVLHELGHVVDFALVSDELDDRLDAGIPRTGRCDSSSGVPTGACAEPAERFADTFAKWALRGAVSVVGAGYGVPMPLSLEDWGAPLGALANELALPG
jgi:hypothetical protein